MTLPSLTSTLFPYTTLFRSLLLFIFGLLLALFLSLWVAPRLMQDGWFERSIFTWGWSTGAVATGIAMLRVVDPELKSNALEDFGIAYIPVTPVEISAVRSEERRVGRECRARVWCARAQPRRDASV